MKRIIMAAAMAAALAAPAGAAKAGVYADDLGKCLVSASSDADKAGLVLWVFAVMSEHPTVKPHVKFSPDQRKEFSRKAAELMMRLLAEDCRKESVQAFKYEGSDAVGVAFGMLGEIAMTQLMNNSAVQNGLEDIADHVDPARFEALAREAGLATGR